MHFLSQRQIDSEFFFAVCFILNAYEAKYGERALPNYDFSKAETIVSIGADFLGDWAGGGYDVKYALGRIPVDGKMSRHIQFEANMTNTGSMADKRVPVNPSQQRAVLSAIHGQIVGGSSSGELPARNPGCSFKGCGSTKEVRKPRSCCIGDS